MIFRNNGNKSSIELINYNDKEIYLIKNTSKSIYVL